jgi:hypothetical protein
MENIDIYDQLYGALASGENAKKVNAGHNKIIYTAE